MTLRRIRLAWYKFWFSRRSPIPVAIMRILLGLLVLDFCMLARLDIDTLFGAHGIVSPSTTQEWLGGRQLNLISLLPTSDQSLQFLFAALVLASLCLTVGLCTRLSALIVFLCLLSLDSQNHFVLHSGYTLLRLMILYMIFSTAGDALSADRLLRVWIRRAADTGPPRPGSAWPQRLMQVQLAIFYWSAFSWKLHGEMWVNGTAVFYAARIAQVQRFDFPYVFDHLWTCRLITWMTLIIEGSLCTLIWIRELRYWVLLAGVCLHLGLEYTFATSILQPVMISCYVVFIDPSTLVGIMDRVRHFVLGLVGERLLAVYDGACDFSCRLAETIRRLDVLRLVKLVEISELTGAEASKLPALPRHSGILVFSRHHDLWLSGARSLQYLSWRLPLILPVNLAVWLPGADKLVCRQGALLEGLYCGGVSERGD